MKQTETVWMFQLDQSQSERIKRFLARFSVKAIKQRVYTYETDFFYLRDHDIMLRVIDRAGERIGELLRPCGKNHFQKETFPVFGFPYMLEIDDEVACLTDSSEIECTTISCGEKLFVQLESNAHSPSYPPILTLHFSSDYIQEAEKLRTLLLQAISSDSL